MNRKSEMASAASASNFRWPYGWPGSGALRATRMPVRPITLLEASSAEWKPSATMLSAPDRNPNTSLSAATSRLRPSTIQSTRPTAAWRELTASRACNRSSAHRGSGAGDHVLCAIGHPLQLVRKYDVCCAHERLQHTPSLRFGQLDLRGAAG